MKKWDCLEKFGKFTLSEGPESFIDKFIPRRLLFPCILFESFKKFSANPYHETVLWLMIIPRVNDRTKCL